jgi:hypothetical protein
LLLVVVLLPVLLAAEIALVRQIGSRSYTQTRQVERVPGLPRVLAPPPAILTPPLQPSVEPTPAPEPSKTPASSPPPAQVSIELREALGGLTGSHLSQAHLSIGLIADAVEKELYHAAQGRKLLDAVAGLLDAVGQKLRQVPLNTLPLDDDRDLERALGVEKLLRSQIEELRLYWKSGDRDRAGRFHTVRKRTWVALDELLHHPSAK